MTENRLVFVVEDDSAVRDSLIALGRVENLEIVAFSSGEEFLVYIAQHPESVHESCLILDVQLQGIDGISLYKELRSENIVLPTIILTGHDEDHALLKDREKFSFVVLLKPTSPKRLLEQIEALFAGDYRPA